MALFMEGSTLKGVVVTNPMVYDTHIVLNVIAFAGWDMKAWAQVAHEYLQEVKVKSGAQFIEFVTTRSWTQRRW